jgi:tetratricopeptide (TPR) repeat protein
MKKIILFLIFSVFTVQASSQLEYYKGYRDGFKEGYCHGDVGCVAPIAPVGPAKSGENFFSYKDGYNNGYAAGIQARDRDNSSYSNQYQTYRQSSSNIISMYNPRSQQQLTNALMQRQALFDQNKNYADDLLNWIEILKTQTNDSQFNSALNKYKSTLLLLKKQDLSAVGNEIRQIERNVELELAKAVARAENGNSYNSKSNTNKGSSSTANVSVKPSKTDFSPGDIVILESRTGLRNKPSTDAEIIEYTDSEQEARIVRNVDNVFYELDLNGRSFFVTFMWFAKKNSLSTSAEIKDNNKQVSVSNKQKTTESIYNSAVEAYNNGNFLEARNKLNSLIAEERNSTLYHFRGFTYLRERDFISAINDFKEALLINPTDTGCYYNLAYTEYLIEDYQNALINFTKAINLGSDRLNAYFFRGIIKSELGDIRGAISDYDFIISEFHSIDDNSFRATVLNNKAYCLVGLDDYDSALPLVNNALTLEKDKSFIWDTRGELYYKTGKFQECISDMTKALSIEESENSFFYRGLARIMLKDKKGCEDLSKAGELGKMEAYDEIKKYCN